MKNIYKAIRCEHNHGPVFGEYFDVGIYDNCNRVYGGCTNYGRSYSSYECNSSNKKTLFTNIVEHFNTNYFNVSDYEVFTYN